MRRSPGRPRPRRKMRGCTTSWASRGSARTPAPKFCASSPASPTDDAACVRRDRPCLRATARLRPGHSSVAVARVAPTHASAIATSERVATSSPRTSTIDRNGRTFHHGAIVENETLHLPDWSLVDLPDTRTASVMQSVARSGISALLAAPARVGNAIGLLVLARKQPGMFADERNCAGRDLRDQAVIAIENVRLFNETQEALERQTATADILKVIASSPSDVQPVFDAIAASANKLIGGFSTARVSLHRRHGPSGRIYPDQSGGRRSPESFVSRSLITGGSASSRPGAERRDVRRSRTPRTAIPKPSGNCARARGFRSMMFVAADEQRRADRLHRRHAARRPVRLPTITFSCCKPLPTRP